MATMTGQFEQLAWETAQRVAELLGAAVAVINDRGTIVASSDPSGGGPVRTPLPGRPLRVPVRLEGRDAEVLIVPVVEGERLDPRLAGAIVELTLNQAVIGRLPNQHELRNKFIHDVLQGVAGDEADLIREAQVLGMDLSRPRAVILIDAADYILAPAGERLVGGRGARLQRSFVHARHVIASVVSYFQLPDETICAYIGDGEVAVLKASATRDLEPWRGDGAGESPTWADLTALKRAAEGLLTRLQHDTGAPISIGLGRYHPGVRGLARSYQDARAALAIGRRFAGHNRVHSLDGLGLAAFIGLADERTKVELARHLLSPLEEAPELVDTLRTFFAADCSPSAAAARLHIHRNTLAYRLEKAALLTGLDPRRFDDAVQLRLALALHQPDAGADCADAQPHVSAGP